MQAVTHLHQPSAELQAVYLNRLLRWRHPCLAVVRHSSIDILALPRPEDAKRKRNPEDAHLWHSAEPLTKTASWDFNARILGVSVIETCWVDEEQQALAVLTDHHNPRLLILSTSCPHDSVPKTSLPCEPISLDEMARSPAEMGLGVWTAYGPHRDDYAVLTHTHVGVLKVFPLGHDSVKGYKSDLKAGFSAR